jgi:hypothetical protein
VGPWLPATQMGSHPFEGFHFFSWFRGSTPFRRITCDTAKNVPSNVTYVTYRTERHIPTKHVNVRDFPGFDGELKAFVLGNYASVDRQVETLSVLQEKLKRA